MKLLGSSFSSSKLALVSTVSIAAISHISSARQSYYNPQNRHRIRFHVDLNAGIPVITPVTPRSAAGFLFQSKAASARKSCRQLTKGTGRFVRNFQMIWHSVVL